MSGNGIAARPTVRPLDLPTSALALGEPPDVVTKFGGYVLGAYIFCAWGRIPELMAMKVGFAPPVMPLLMGAAMLMSVLAGGMLRFLTNRAFILFAAYYVWIVICIPTSIWKGTSLEMVLYQLKMALIFIAITSLVRTTRQIRHVLTAIAASMIVLAAVGQRMGGEDDYRFSFDAGSLSNPNELANHLLIGLPLSWVIAVGSGRFSWRSLVRYSVLIASGYMLLKTGSRGGIVTAALLTVVLLFSFSLANKVKLALACAFAVIASLAIAPKAVIERYRTLVSDDASVPGEAVGSTNSREELLKASLRITAQHPVFGVGPGAFVMAYNQERYAIGLRHHWEATHNAYTQVSSETGIPALLFYLGAFYVSMKRLLELRAAAKRLPEFNTLYRTSSVLLLSMLAYLSSGLFTSNAHEFYFPILIGLGLVLAECGNQEIAAATGSRPAVVQQPPIRPVRLPPVRRVGARPIHSRHKT